MDRSSIFLHFLRRASLFKDVLVAILMGNTLLIPCYAGIPDWWVSRRGVRTEVTDDVYAALNVGQMKNMVSGAIAEMNAKLISEGGAGVELNAILAEWNLQKQNPNNYEMVNAGQLKSILKKFYDRMNTIHGTSGYTARKLLLRGRAGITRERGCEGV